ncbi:MAG: DUF1993 domain-containing protein [Terricaulis sp.]
MSISIYAASAPMFATMLNNLNALLDKAEANAKERGFDVGVLLQSRLAPDMFTLIGQVQLATAFAKNTMCRLAGANAAELRRRRTTLPQLRDRIARALDIVQSISEADLEGAEKREVTFNVGPDAKMTVSGADYLFRFALPNFYFHVTTAYDILRHNGVVLSKKDFLAGTMKLPG